MTTESVLQEWVVKLPLRYQGTLLTAVRGCDDEPKQWTATGFSDSPGRRITAYIRWCFMNPADPREVDVLGAFFQSKPPSPFRPSEFGHLPQHWYAHIMHALEIIGYEHPKFETRETALALYRTMVKSLHLNPESMEQLLQRLTEDRIANGTVVDGMHPLAKPTIELAQRMYEQGLFKPKVAPATIAEPAVPASQEMPPRTRLFAPCVDGCYLGPSHLGVCRDVNDRVIY